MQSAVTAERLSCGVQGRSSGRRHSYDSAARSGTESEGPTHPSHRRQPESRCRSWLQSHHNAAGEPCAQSEVKEGEGTKF